jgi:MFS family permease
MALRFDRSVRDGLPYHMIMLDDVRRRIDQFDVLHFHIDLLPAPVERDIADRCGPAPGFRCERTFSVALIVGLPDAAESSPSRASLNGLDGTNFFNAAMLAGFGPYVAVYLAEQKWTQENIGFVLTASGLAGLLALMPGGQLLDTVRSKRALVALGASMVAVTALVIGIWPNFPLVFTALVLHGTTGAFLGPAIAAISLGVVGHFALAEQLGRNQRFASAGSLIATALMGLIGYLLSYQAMFLIAAALVLPLLAALAAIRPADIDFARSCGAAHPDAATQPARTGHRSLWKSPEVLTFAASLFLFQLANAAMLPVVGAALVYEGESRSSLIVAALIILPQAVVALSAPWVGRQARSWGRRPLLIIGFGTLPIRALLFAFFEDPLFLIGFQLLDGISGAIIGVLTALVTADITHGSGRFNLAQGIIGTASGIGAALSTAVFGLIAANFGHTTTFLSMAAVALLGASIMWLLMPETRPSTEK